MISQTQHIALSILLISLGAINNNESLLYTSATSDVTSNTLNTRLRSNTDLRINSNSAATKSGEEGAKLILDIDKKSRRELQEDVVDQREDSIEGQEELFISQNCLNLLAASTDPNHHIRAENFFIFTDAYSNSYFSTNNMTSYSDLPEENQHVFITIACQCGIVGEESNCCQANRAHIDLSELYDSNGYPENMSLQFLEYLYDVCSTTRAVIGTNVLKPSGEGSMNNNVVGVVDQEGGEGGTEGGTNGDDSEGGDGEDVGPLGITFYRPKPVPPTTADKVDEEAAEGSDANGSEGSEDSEDESDSEDETNTDAVTEGDVEPREASSTDNLSTGGIIGIAVAGGVVLLAILAFLVMRNKKKKNSGVVDDDANIKLSGTSPPPPNMNDVNGMMMTNPQQAPDDITNVTTDDYSTATENHGTPVTTGSFANASSPSSNLNKLDSLNDPNDTTMLSNNAKGQGPSELWPGQV